MWHPSFYMKGNDVQLAQTWRENLRQLKYGPKDAVILPLTSYVNNEKALRKTKAKNVAYN